MTALRILVVDDNRDAADTLAALLAAMGHTTATAHDGDAAEAAMRAHVEAALNARIRAMRGREIPMEDE